ncbi:MAG: hypothetical protein WBN66_13110 [Smithella sp.]
MSLEKSALEWATLPVGGQNSSWNDVRSYYYTALTSANKTTRELYFAKTFKGVGQIMHLVQDMSVPGHTRGDKHPSVWRIGGDDYEEWFLKNTAQPISGYSPYSVYVPYNSSFLIPQLFDSGQYQYIENKLNPEVTLYPNIGLAEYTNANFFSSDTILATNNFPYPSWLGLRDNPQTTQLGKKKYLSKIGEGEIVNRFARKNLFYSWLPNGSKSAGLTLDDDGINEDYAEKLIPRAIGYSSSLLNYFFRGEIEAKLLPVFDESKLESVRIKVRNMTPSKDAMGGNNDSKFYLAYCYRPPGAPADGSQDIWSKVPYVYPLPNILPYGKDENGNYLNDPEHETEILFGGFTVDIPISNYQNAQFMLIYRGNLGEEKTNLANNELGGIIGKFGASKPITFHEENNTAPKGDYNWFQMDSTVFGSNVCPYHNIDHGVAQNDIINGKLIKTNIRYPIILAPDETKEDLEGTHLNTSLIGVNSLSGSTYANNVFPIPITKDTYIEFKIDDMTISPNTTEGGNYTHFQCMVLSFNNGYKLEFSLDDQFWYINNATGYFSFDAGYVIVDNIYDLFQQWNLPIPADFKLNYIRLFQQIGFNLPLDTQYEQKMIVDFIRIVEMEKMGPE